MRIQTMAYDPHRDPIAPEVAFGGAQLRNALAFRPAGPLHCYISILKKKKIEVYKDLPNTDKNSISEKEAPCTFN